MSLVRDEIAEQPAAVARVVADADGAIAAAAAEIVRRRPSFAVIAARGSSDNAARYAQHVLGRLCGLPVALAAPSCSASRSRAPRQTSSPCSRPRGSRAA